MALFDFVSSDFDRADVLEFQDHCIVKGKLNLGSNIDCRKAYVNVDILDFPDLDVRCDIVNLAEYIPSECFNEIIAYDVLEHFPFAQTSLLLHDWVSWLTPGGKIIVRVPDMEKLAHALFDKTIPTFEIGRLIMGGQDYDFNFHKACFTGDYLEGLLIGAGCSRNIQIVREPDTFNVTVVAVK